jgi:hypothetical protein
MTTSANYSWDEEQLSIIQSCPSKRILVDAGPGTGKTAVACAKVAWLIENCNIEPTEIWIFSFTRTAVREIKNRIKEHLRNPDDAGGIKIATLDSHSWSISNGFSESKLLFDSYENSIRSTIKIIQEHSGVFEYLSQLKHLIIDEAQDIVGPRIELILEIINSLPPSAGVTVFSDEAQAIYGFSEKDNDDLRGTLPSNITKYMNEDFTKVELTKIHRTQNISLNSVQINGRSILKSSDPPDIKFRKIINLVKKECSPIKCKSLQECISSIPQPESSLILFRRRAEVLTSSNSAKTLPHRLRVSNLPAMTHSWIADLLWDFTDNELSRSDFFELWESRKAIGDRFSAWQALNDSSGISENKICIRSLATKLASTSPPLSLIRPDFGYEGPILGTIHSSKGREANHVRLFLQQDDENSSEEEARTIYVGATRAKLSLEFGLTPFHKAEKSTRLYTPRTRSDNGLRLSRAQIEIGLNDDIEAAGLVGKSFFESEEAAKAAQTALRSLDRKITMLEASSSLETNWYYAVKEQEKEKQLFFLSQRLNSDLFDIGKKINQKVHLNQKKPPIKIQNLRSFGNRTIAIAPDSQLREKLHWPWSESGFISAPLLLSYSYIYFRK